ncbi:hypothetical protein F5Y17DRAFT_214086 [Xylariaceae sp. FL0594]|nr:hypothetical protein F5Y17DRAFT_214086 [Xylariaceae sp. FL0594]
MAPRFRYFGLLARICLISTIFEKRSSPARPSDVGKSEATREKGCRPEPAPEDCPICHEPVGIETPEGVAESWVYLYCGHKFGTHCIQRWLQDSAEQDPHSVPTCPYCRRVARHPCGHAVSVPVPKPWYPYTIWPTALNLTPGRPYRPHNRQMRRRFERASRRPPGHTSQHPDPYRPQAVGQCSRCEANPSPKEMATQRVRPAVEGSDSTGGRRRGNTRMSKCINFMFSLKNLLRPSSPASHPAQVRNEIPGDSEEENLCMVETVV